jgi:hypothetical protein
MKQTAFIVVLFIGLVGCIPKARPTAAITATPVPIVSSTLIPTPVDVFEVQAWMDKKTPGPDQRVIAFGSLLKNHIRLGGFMMKATWPQGMQDGSTAECFVLVTYGRGKCLVDTSQLPPGVYVSVMISFDYRGKRYTGQTGFTP